jgi:hypothetical protein
LRERPTSAILIASVAIVSVIAVGCEDSPDTEPARSREPRSEHRPSAAGPSVLRMWAAENESIDHDPTRLEAIRGATGFDAILALRETYPSHVASMRSANPDVQLLVYVMGTYAWKGQPPGTYPESWYLKDRTGAYVRSMGVWPDHYLMDPRKPGWVADRIHTCQTFLRASGYDGCMVDMLGLASLSPSYVTGVPIDPRTGVPWTPEAWLRATSSLAADMKRAAQPALVIANGLGPGSVYFADEAPSAQLLAGIDGGIAEAWLRSAWELPNSFPSVERWRQDVDMLADAERDGKVVMTYTKLWADADAATSEAWYWFALTSFLLGTNGHSSFAFSAGRYDDPMRPFAEEVDLGAPLSGYRQIGLVFDRLFERGRVVVNPTDAPRVVELDEGFVTLDGASVDQRLLIEPHTGEILLAAG